MILFSKSDTSNELFSVDKDGKLHVQDPSHSCVVSQGVGRELLVADCTGASSLQWRYEASSQQLTASFHNGTQLCVQAHYLPAQLQLGVLIQGKYKLIRGYPGSGNTKWDGWVPCPDMEHVQAQLVVPLQAAAAERPCEAKPCLFDIEADPNEVKWKTCHAWSERLCFFNPYFFSLGPAQ